MGCTTRDAWPRGTHSGRLHHVGGKIKAEECSPTFDTELSLSYIIAFFLSLNVAFTDGRKLKKNARCHSLSCPGCWAPFGRERTAQAGGTCSPPGAWPQGHPAPARLPSRPRRDPTGPGGAEVRGAVPGAWPAPSPPRPAPPGQAASLAARPAEAGGRTAPQPEMPRGAALCLRLWLCLGLLDGERGELSAAARVRARPRGEAREGTLLGRLVGPRRWGRAGSWAPAGPGSRGDGAGARDTDAAGALRGAERRGRAGQGPAPAAPQRRDGAGLPTSPRRPRSAPRGPARSRCALTCSLRFPPRSPRSPGPPTPRPARPRATRRRCPPGRRDRSARFPTPRVALEVGPAGGAPGRRAPSPKAGVAGAAGAAGLQPQGQGFGVPAARRRREDPARCGNLRRTWRRQLVCNEGRKRQEAGRPVCGGAGSLTAEPGAGLQQGAPAGVGLVMGTGREAARGVGGKGERRRGGQRGLGWSVRDRRSWDSTRDLVTLETRGQPWVPEAGEECGSPEGRDGELTFLENCGQ